MTSRQGLIGSRLFEEAQRLHLRVQQVLESVAMSLTGDAASYARRTELYPTLLRKPQKSSLKDVGKDGTSNES